VESPRATLDKPCSEVEIKNKRRYFTGPGVAGRRNIMAEETGGKKVRVCPTCKTRTEDPGGKACPICGANLLTICPSCDAMLEGNGDARECKVCGFAFGEG
jgi:hypothetical protein